MMLVDSHCHLDCLDLSEKPDGLQGFFNRAKAADIGHFLCVCITHTDFKRMAATVAPFENVSLSVGTHPNEQLEDEPTIQDLVQLANTPKVVAIGETGLDYYRSQGDITWQQTRFRNHIQAALDTNKPLIVHSRQAKEDTIRILKEEQAERVGGVLHCFTEDLVMAEQALELGFYISFSGIITFSNASALRDVIKQLPLEHILIETDSPYLAPMPFRGKSNEPAYVRYVAEKVAEIKEESLETIARITTENFFQLFKQATMQ